MIVYKNPKLIITNYKNEKYIRLEWIDYTLSSDFQAGVNFALKFNLRVVY